MVATPPARFGDHTRSTVRLRPKRDPDIYGAGSECIGGTPWDTRPSLNTATGAGGGIVGRFVNSEDGTLSDSDFILADASQMQSFPNVAYVPEKEMYFSTWMDNRNGDQDVYVKWLSATGESIGSDFAIYSGEGNQQFPQMAYNPLMDRFLIVWAHSEE